MTQIPIVCRPCRAIGLREMSNFARLRIVEAYRRGSSPKAVSADHRMALVGDQRFEIDERIAHQSRLGL